MSNIDPRAVWPGWETVRLIGRGSFGAVYEIRRDVFGDTEKAALKVISIPQSDSDIQEMVSDGYDEESITSTFQAHLKSIVAEYSLMRKLNGSANVVNCDDVRYVQHEDGYGWDIFIKMELLTPLAEALPAKVPEEQAVKIGKDLARALVQCRQFDIVHRDIKPQNIFVSPLGDYKLGDFGIAKTVEKTSGGTKIGTYKYMAPEVYNNQPYGAGADIYSLGLVLYWLLNERRMPFLPLPPEKLKAGMEEQARLRRFGGEALPAPAHGSPALRQIVLRACAYDPKARYQSAEELLQALEALGAIHESPVDPGERRFAPVGVGVLDDPKTVTDGNGLSRAPAPARETAISEEEATVGVFGSASVGATSGRPAVTPTPEPENAMVRAPIARGEDATVGVFGAAKAEKPAPVGAEQSLEPRTLPARRDALGGPQKTEPSPEEDGTVSVFDTAAPVGTTIGRPPAASGAETPNNTVGAGLAPARGRGQATGVPGGASPSPTAEDEDKTRGAFDRKAPQPDVPRPETQKSRPGRFKKKHILLAGIAAVLTVMLIGLLLLKTEQNKRAAAERARQEQLAAETAAAYENALALLENGLYEEAIAAFETLGDCRDSRSRVSEAEQRLEEAQNEEKCAAEYARAEALANSGEYYMAALVFYQIKDYRDSWDRCFALWGQITGSETLSAGGYHTVGLRADGTVVATGNNASGHCDVSGWTDVVAISAGENHTVGLRADGTVVATGWNNYGQCDVSDWTDVVAVSAEENYTVGLRADGTVVGLYQYYAGAGDFRDVAAISSGYNHTVGLKADGTVVATGSNASGQCDVSGWRNVVAVSAGGFHTVGLRADGTVVATGYNEYSQCYVSGWRDVVAISSGYNHTVGLKADGTVVATGSNASGQCDVSGWRNVVAVSAGNSHTVGLLADGRVVAAGSNRFGQCDVSTWRLALPTRQARN